MGLVNIRIPHEDREVSDIISKLRDNEEIEISYGYSIVHPNFYYIRCNETLLPYIKDQFKEWEHRKSIRFYKIEV